MLMPSSSADAAVGENAGGSTDGCGDRGTEVGVGGGGSGGSSPTDESLIDGRAKTVDVIAQVDAISSASSTGDMFNLGGGGSGSDSFVGEAGGRPASVLVSGPVSVVDENRQQEKQSFPWTSPNVVEMDSTVFGTGCCCLQVTLQAHTLSEARFMYDQFVVLSPFMLAVTASTPIFKGMLVDGDVRWSVVRSHKQLSTFLFFLPLSSPFDDCLSFSVHFCQHTDIRRH